MKAGRELDALIAEKVMGWTHVRQASTPYDLTSFGKGELIGILDEYRPDIHCSIPHYSTSIAAAFEVWEQLPKHWRTLHQRENGTWDVLEDGPDYEDLLLAHAETAPLVICLAALKAFENNPRGGYAGTQQQ